MRRDPWFLNFSPADLPDVAGCDGCCATNGGGGGGGCSLCSGLCCPNDLLDAVIEENLDEDDALLKDLAVAAAFLPSSGEGVVLPNGGHGRGKPPPTGGHGRGKSATALRIIMGWDRSVPSDDGAPGPPDQTESPDPDSPPPPHVSRLLVPRRKRGRTERGKRTWSLQHVPDAPPHSPSGGGSDDREDSGRGSAGSGGGGGGGARQCPAPRPRNRLVHRVCSHCDETETPQWRAGPYGPGTLCNACGLRFKQNKLVPGYRPSSSPSFRSDLHSNRYRKAAKLSAEEAGEEGSQPHVLVPPAGGGATPW